MTLYAKQEIWEKSDKQRANLIKQLGFMNLFSLERRSWPPNILNETLSLKKIFSPAPGKKITMQMLAMILVGIEDLDSSQNLGKIRQSKTAFFKRPWWRWKTIGLILIFLKLLDYQLYQFNDHVETTKLKKNLSQLVTWCSVEAKMKSSEYVMLNQ